MMATMDPRASSPCSCPSCGRSLPWEVVAHLLEDDALHHCTHCSVSFTLAMAGLEALHPHLLQEAGAREALWWHATQRDFWWEGITEAGVALHVGEAAAAWDMALLNEEVKPQGYFHLYALRLRGPLTWLPQAPDEDLWPEYSPPGVVQPYVNRWEAPGTVSLLLGQEVLQVVAHERVEAARLASLSSVYNLPRKALPVSCFH